MMGIDETNRRGDSQGLADAVVGVESIAQTLMGAPRREGLQSVLDTVLCGALRVVPGARSATTLLLDRRQQIAARASSDPAAAELDDLQVALGEGPTLEAAFSSAVAGSTNLYRAVKWPRWAAHAAGFDYSAVLAVPLQGQLVRGALTLCRTTDDVALDEAMARLVACAAAMALDHAVDVSGPARALEVHYLRTLDDSDRLRTLLASATRVAVIGASVLGTTPIPTTTPSASTTRSHPRVRRLLARRRSGPGRDEGLHRRHWTADPFAGGRGTGPSGPTPQCRWPTSPGGTRRHQLSSRMPVVSRAMTFPTSRPM